MAYFVFNLVALILLIGFLILTSYEERKGVRVASAVRSDLDERVTRLQFLLTHIDLAAFVREELRRGVKYLGHLMVALSLKAVRALERLLTRLIVYLRTRYPVDTPQAEGTRPFLKTLSDFKDRLKNTTRSDSTDIE